MHQLRQEQHYPTYDFEDRRVVELELQDAYREASGQGRLYTQLSSVLLGIATLGFSLANVLGNGTTHLFGKSSLFYLAWAAFFVGFLLITYFADLQRSVTLSRRKVVVLRTMLGLDYGPIQAVLPANTIDGAVNPYVIRLFPGWFSYVALPFWLIAITTGALWLGVQSVVPAPLVTWISWPKADTWIVLGFWVLLYAMRFRRGLFENHETFLLLMANNIAKALRVRFVPSVEYAMYRAKLAAVELERLGFDTHNLRDLLVRIEDKRFYRHHGVDVRALIRATASYLPRVRQRLGLIPSGASTLSMQLARSLLIVDYHKTIRRKLLEVPLAIWLEGEFSKEQILNMYLASVRFAPGVYGLAAATKHYFHQAEKRDYTSEEAFLLVERLSSTDAGFREERIQALLNALPNDGVGPEARLCATSVAAVYRATLGDANT